jgi:hypothetical protein
MLSLLSRHYVSVFIWACIFLMGFGNQATAQSNQFKKGNFYFFWGYNRAHYSVSNIHFEGENYDITLSHVRANDRQSKLGVDPYLKIDQITIPQYNYRLGYMLNDHYNISLGFDHMKYVVSQDQNVHVNGYIYNSGTAYDGEYVNREIKLKSDFLEFEHTDGLNYINSELTRTDALYSYKKWTLSGLGGLGIGVMFPRTRAVVLSKDVNDEWHFSGFGTSAHIGLNVLYGKHFFLQGKLKAGYINMPNIVTNSNRNDKADQHFSFLQTNVVLGYKFDLKSKKK